MPDRSSEPADESTNEPTEGPAGAADETSAPTAPGPTPTDSWNEVGEQLRILGETLAGAVRTAFEDEQNRERMSKVREDLEAMASEFGKAMKEAAGSPEGQRVRETGERVAEHVRAASQRTGHEVGPKVRDALAMANDQIKRVFATTDADRPAEAGSADRPADVDTAQRQPES